MTLLIKLSLIVMVPIGSANAFSLLGPYEDWMQETNGYRWGGDIGGPVKIGEEYRWNVPTLTYGFDPSFVAYFGSNGVAAVERAIQTLNELPTASDIVLTNFPLYAEEQNYAAHPGVQDLKSATFFFLLEQLGLASPTRNVFVLRRWNDIVSPGWPPTFEMDWPTNAIPDLVEIRNFDPETLLPSHVVDGTHYSGEIWNLGGWLIASPFNDDPYGFAYPAVADWYWKDFWYYNGITRDDVGGLRYLLRSNNINYEIFLPGVHGVGTNVDSYVNGAWRPGVEKITFVPQLYDSSLGQFLPMTNQFIDTILTNGATVHQSLERIVIRPDILFQAGDIRSDQAAIGGYSRTGVTNWLNLAALNGRPGSPGPGVIQPPVTITFDKLMDYLESNGENDSDDRAYRTGYRWGSFDFFPDPPIQYPSLRTDTVESVARLLIFMRSGTNSWDVESHRFDWRVSGLMEARFGFQSSTNLSDWISLGTFTNEGGVFPYVHAFPASSQRYYRIVPD